jgi:hypothetical protein
LEGEEITKIGILTFHYSNNYGGVLQALALQNTIRQLGYEVEIINYIPSNYKPTKVFSNLGIRKNVFKNKLKDLNLVFVTKKVNIKKKYSRNIVDKFNIFRTNEMTLSKQVDEDSLKSILGEYSVIIVGSDQVWNPSQRKRKEYFLDFGFDFQGEKISYAADSTISHVNSEELDTLKNALGDFKHISVRNQYSLEFVKSIINKEAKIVVDPTILIDLKSKSDSQVINEDYILTYILGQEIEGTHTKAIQKIKKIYGDIPVYSIKIPTMNFQLSSFADKTFYDLDPNEWMNMFTNAKFIYTDSFHGVLFSLKNHKPFLAYYAEKMRATRFVDLGRRYDIERFIVNNVNEIEEKSSISIKPDFDKIDRLLEEQKESSLKFLEEALENKLIVED